MWTYFAPNWLFFAIRVICVSLFSFIVCDVSLLLRFFLLHFCAHFLTSLLFCLHYYVAFILSHHSIRMCMFSAYFSSASIRMSCTSWQTSLQLGAVKGITCTETSIIDRLSALRSILAETKFDSKTEHRTHTHTKDVKSKLLLVVKCVRIGWCAQQNIK